MITTSPNALDLRSRQLIYTQPGLEAFTDSEELYDLVRAFNDEPSNFHRELFTDRFKLIGQGNMSDVRLVGGYAVKLSTPTTGLLKASTSTKRDRSMHSPEDLVLQTRFLTRLGMELLPRSGGKICVPEQYLAISPIKRHSLAIMQFMEDRITLYDWIDRENVGGEDKWHATTIVRDRLETAIGDSVLRAGLSDLFRTPEFDEFGQFYGNLHQANLLIPATTRSIGDLATTNICTIDQPGVNVDTHFRTWLAMRQISRQPGYTDPFVH